MHRKITDEDRDDFTKAYESGVPSRRLADHYGCSKTTVLERAHCWGLTRPIEYLERQRAYTKANLHESDEALRIRWQELLPDMREAIREAVKHIMVS